MEINLNDRQRRVLSMTLSYGMAQINDLNRVFGYPKANDIDPEELAEVSKILNVEFVR